MKLIEWWNKLTAMWKVITAIGILIMLMFAVDLGIYFTNGNLVVGTDGDWIGFWGSFLGSLIGVVGAVEISYCTTKKQIKESRRQLSKQLKESRKNELNNAIKLNDIRSLGKMVRSTKEILSEFRETDLSYKTLKLSDEAIVDKKTARANILKNEERIASYKQIMNAEISTMIGEIKEIKERWDTLDSRLTVLNDSITALKEGSSQYGPMVNNFNLAISTLNDFEKQLTSCYKNYVNE